MTDQTLESHVFYLKPTDNLLQYSVIQNLDSFGTSSGQFKDNSKITDNTFGQHWDNSRTT